MQVAGSWARSTGKFSGSDFTLVDERALRCPAGHDMYRREMRQSRHGDLLILFGLNPRKCQQCSLKSQCLADGSKEVGGRRVTVIRKKLTTPAPQPLPAATSSQPEPERLPPTRLSEPVVWQDYPTTRLRRARPVRVLALALMTGLLGRRPELARREDA